MCATVCLELIHYYMEVHAMHLFDAVSVCGRTYYETHSVTEIHYGCLRHIKKRKVSLYYQHIIIQKAEDI